MTTNDPGGRDDELRNRFAALRREEESDVPEFALPSPSGKGPAGQRFIVLTVACCLATMVVAVFLLRPVPPKPEREAGNPVASLTEWKAPTDFLLETPGRELLRNVPAIGVWPDRTQAPRLEQKHPQVRKQALP